MGGSHMFVFRLHLLRLLTRFTSLLIAIYPLRSRECILYAWRIIQLRIFLSGETHLRNPNLLQSRHFMNAVPTGLFFEELIYPRDVYL